MYNPKSGFNKDGYALEGKYIFQGFNIHVENAVGSVRTWTDAKTGETGYTVMRYDYGYFADTYADADGDEVDCYVGNDRFAKQVHVIDQMSKEHGFTTFDEQKVMLGFSSSLEAKIAYLAHYNDHRFFGCMRSYNVEEFREKLTNNTGEIIKSRLKTVHSSDRIRGNMSKSIVEYAFAAMPLVNDTGMSPARAYALQKAGYTGTRVQMVNPEVDSTGIGTDRVAPLHEPRAVPVRRVDINDPTRYGA